MASTEPMTSPFELSVIWPPPVLEKLGLKLLRTPVRFNATM